MLVIMKSSSVHQDIEAKQSVLNRSPGVNRPELRVKMAFLLLPFSVKVISVY